MMEMNEINDALISAVERRPVLFDKTEENYSNRHYINKMWRDIGNELGIDDMTAKKKWTKLRDYFQRNHRMMTLQAQASHNSPSEALKAKRKWYLYDRLQFVLPFLTVRQNYGNDNDHDNLSQVSGEDYTEDPMENSEFFSVVADSGSAANVKAEDAQYSNSYNNNNNSSSSSSQPKKKRKKSLMQRKPMVFHQELEESHASLEPSEFDQDETWTRMADSENKNDNDDDDDLYCRSLVPKIRLLGPIAKMECQVEIHQVIIKYLKQTELVPADSGEVCQFIQLGTSNKNGSSEKNKLPSETTTESESLQRRDYHHPQHTSSVSGTDLLLAQEQDQP